MNDFCNCGCGFNPGSDYNAFGDIGYNLPLIYEVYCKTIHQKNFAECCEAIKVRDASNNRGTLPMFAQRMISAY